MHIYGEHNKTNGVWRTCMGDIVNVFFVFVTYIFGKQKSNQCFVTCIYGKQLKTTNVWCTSMEHSMKPLVGTYIGGRKQIKPLLVYVQQTQQSTTKACWRTPMEQQTKPMFLTYLNGTQNQTNVFDVHVLKTQRNNKIKSVLSHVHKWTHNKTIVCFGSSMEDTIKPLHCFSYVHLWKTH